MHVWDRIHCRWRVWHGTLKAWKALPHAIIGASCTVTLGALAVYHLPVRPQMPPVPVQPVSAAVYMVGIPTAAPTAPYLAMPTSPPPFIAPVPAHRCEKLQDHDRDDCKRPRTVDETSSGVLFAGALCMLGVALYRRRNHG